MHMKLMFGNRTARIHTASPAQIAVFTPGPNRGRIAT